MPGEGNLTLGTDPLVIAQTVRSLKLPNRCERLMSILGIGRTISSAINRSLRGVLEGPRLRGLARPSAQTDAHMRPHILGKISKRATITYVFCSCRPRGWC